jgi:signal transduction histidine kinase
VRRWLRADLARPELPTSRDELTFLLVAPIAIIAIAQLTDPAPVGTVLLLAPAVAGFVLRALVPRFPAEAFALMVVVPVTVAVGLDGDLQGAFFLGVTMVIYVAWSLASVTRATAITAVATAVPWLVATHLAPEADLDWHPWVMAHVFVFALGRTLHRQRALIDQLEAARQALAAQAVAEERRRIARELHDLAGHTLAAMVLHVTGARHVLRRDLGEAEAALHDAEAVGRSGLDQIRVTVAALRTDERGTDPVLPGSADLSDLVAGYRRAGLAIEADITAAAATVDGPVGVAVHRIAREALTNVARHAPDNRVEVRLSATDDGLRLVVADRGRPAATPDPSETHFGLIGMTERARALGGDLVAGPTPDGWEVAATLPRLGSRPEATTR